jgi:hypothetical protein
MKYILLVVLLSSSYSIGYTQSDKTIFYFEAKKNRTFELKLDTISNKMTFRKFKKHKLLYELVDVLSDSIVVFSYGYYFRGGGAANAGMDINVIYFKQRNSIGVLYYQFESEENSLNIGFNEINLNGRINNFKAIENSFKGNLLDLRFDNIIPVVENEELNFKED